MSITLPDIKDISYGATDICSVDCTDELDGSELVASATVVEVSTSDLTLASLSGTANTATVSTTSLTIKGRTVATGKAIRWQVLGQQLGVTYQVEYTLTTDSEPPRVLPHTVRLRCV